MIAPRQISWPESWNKFDVVVPESILADWQESDVNNLTHLLCECGEYEFEKTGDIECKVVHFNGNVGGDDFLSTCLGGVMASDRVGWMYAISYVVRFYEGIDDESKRKDTLILPVDSHFVDEEEHFMVTTKGFRLERGRFVEVLAVVMKHEKTMRSMLRLLMDDRVYVRQLTVVFIRGWFL